MLYIYEYPDVRDILLILTSSIFNGNDRLNENSEMRGYARLTPRSLEASKDLQKFLDTKHVKFQIMLTPFGEEIKFKYGQNVEVDDTVQQMYDDRAFRRVNDILTNVHNHKMEDPSIAELKELITKVSEVGYGDETEASYYYFYSNDIDRALEMLTEFGLWVEKHTSHATGKPVEVLRLPKSSVGDWGKKLIEELKQAIKDRANEEPYDEEAKHRISELKKHIVWAEHSDPKIWHDKSESVVFTFEQEYADPANYLFGAMGIKVLDIIHEKMVGGNVRIRCAYSKDDPIINAVYKELRKSAEEKRDKGRTPNENAKEKALEQLKKSVRSAHSDEKFVYFGFPYGFYMSNAGLFQKIGLKIHRAYQRDSGVGSNYSMDFIEYSYDENDDTLMSVYQELKKAAEENRDKNRTPDEIAKEKVLNQLKEMITDVKELMSGENHRRYFYFYFPADKIAVAQELMEKVGVSCEQHLSNYEDQERMVLRCQSTMVSGDEAQVIDQLRGAATAKKINGAAARHSQDNFEHGAGKVDDMVALETLKRLIKNVSRLPREQELANPGKSFYCFYFDADEMEKAQGLLSQVGISTETKFDNEGKAYLLYSVKKGEMSDNVVDIIYALDKVSENKKVNYGIQQEIALDKLKNMVTDVQRARGGQNIYYYFYFPDAQIDKAQELMTKYVGDIPEKHVSHALPEERTVLRFLVDDTSAVMGLIEELKSELKKAVESRQKIQDRGMVM